MRYLITGGRALGQVYPSVKNAEVLSDLPETMSAIGGVDGADSPFPAGCYPALRRLDRGWLRGRSKAYHVTPSVPAMFAWRPQVGASWSISARITCLTGKNSPYQEYDPPAPLW